MVSARSSTEQLQHHDSGALIFAFPCQYRRVACGSNENVCGRTMWHHELAEDEMDSVLTQTIEHSKPAKEIAYDEVAHFAAEQLAGYAE